MPLTRGEIVGYDAERRFYEFAMMDGVNTVDCEISNVALNDLALAGRTLNLQIATRYF
jgi:hypothetical protein